MIWGLHIIITVYNQYPTLAFWAHQNFSNNALLELETTKFWFSFKAPPPKMQHMHQSLSRCWVRIYPKQIILLFFEVTFQQNNHSVILRTHS